MVQRQRERRTHRQLHELSWRASPPSLRACEQPPRLPLRLQRRRAQQRVSVLLVQLCAYWPSCLSLKLCPEREEKTESEQATVSAVRMRPSVPDCRAHRASCMHCALLHPCALARRAACVAQLTLMAAVCGLRRLCASAVMRGAECGAMACARRGARGVECDGSGKYIINV